MQNLADILRAKGSAAIVAAFGSALPKDSELLTADVEQSTQPQFGHYQINSALKLSKELRKNPREVAEALISHFDMHSEQGEKMISKAEIAGPGFINLTLDSQYLTAEINRVLNDSHLGVPSPQQKQKVILEFSSPNVAKELHVGHLRSTIIGDCLARLFEFLGHDVLRLSHIGDWGTQFGMLIVYLQEHEPKVLTGEEKTNLSSLMQWYKESKKLFDADPDFKKRAQLQVAKLQGGDSLSRKAWELICDISRRGYQEIYDLLDVKLIERGESFYNEMIPNILADFEKKGLITLSEGAKCVFLEGFVSRDGTPLPMIIQKSDGGYNYETTDVAALWHRVYVEKADRIVYVVDAGQSLHFQMVFAACQKAGYLDPQKVLAEHVAFGVVLGPDGKKFKTRSGETEKLIDLLNEAIDKAQAILKERLPDLSAVELDKLSKALGLGAVKYADLSCHRVKDYVFSYDRMLRFEGNTAAFLLYAYVRIQGIKRKVQRVITSGTILLEHPSEIALALHLRQFGEMLDKMQRELLPNRLTDYLYTLAEHFNAFFRDCRVEGSPQETSRYLLCEATARIMEKGLNILGLQTVDRM